MKIIFKFIYYIFVSTYVATFGIQIRLIGLWEKAIYNQFHSWFIPRIIGITWGILLPIAIIIVGFKVLKKHRSIS